VDTLPAGSTRGSERLALEQAALRRVAMVVAGATPPEEVFAALAAEVARVLGTNYSVMSRYAPDGTATVVGSWPSQGPARALMVGTRLEPGGRNVHNLVFQTGRPARIDDYTDATGKEARIARRYGCRTIVGVPIRLEGQLWGGIFVASAEGRSLPADIDGWLAGFGELMATAIANAQARLELRSYAEEQAALRRVATLVARATPPEDIYGAVATEVGRLLEVDTTVVSRYDPDGTATVVGAWARTGTAGLSAGTRVEKPRQGVHSLVFRTGRPARRNDSAGASDVGRAGRFGAAVGAPISVEGRLWGVIVVGSHDEEPLPAGTEARLAGFTDLLATAIANTQARMERRRFAQEQAALRRVAVLVARAAPPEAVFEAVAGEAGRLLEADVTILSRYDDDGSVRIVAGRGKIDPAVLSAGTEIGPGGRNVHSLVFETGRPARVDDYADASGPAAGVARDWGLRSAVGVPIRVEGRLWGVIVVASTREERLPADAESRLAGFTELVGTALANAEARLELRGYAEEQAALRRVAVLVARAAPPEEVFAAVAAEVGRLVGIDYTVLSRYDGDGAFEVLADWSRDPDHEPGWVGTRFELGGRNVPTLVFETGRPARIDDYGQISGPVAEAVRARGFRSGVGAPVRVGARLWGVMVAAATTDTALPIGIEGRLAGFSELVGTALANAEAQAALTESRARIVAAADDARRRIERDLHDGAQQRLVYLALEAKLAAAELPPEAAEAAARLDGLAQELTDALDELRELAQGIHPVALARGGLPPALEALTVRSPVPVRLDVRVDGRLPEHIELAAYYVVAEALTNAAKHAAATVVDVDVAAGRGALRISVRDDGRGGADLGGGSGLVGLNDRVEALGGRLSLRSPPGAGTTLTITLPLDPLQVGSSRCPPSIS
jgi:signal transduction histidine kinase